MSVHGCGEVVVDNNEELTFTSHPEQPEWLVEAMTNMNRYIVTANNNEILNMPSLLAILNNEVFHYYVDVGGVGYENVENVDPVDE